MTDEIQKTSRWDWFSIPLEWGRLLADVPGVRFDQRTRRWDVHRTHLPLLKAQLGDGVDEILLVDAEPRNHAREGITLRPWQETGLTWIEPRRGVLLADEMRLGKTLTALLAHDPSTGPLLVVGPLDTRSVWMRWFAKVFPDQEAVFLTGRTLDPAGLSAPIIFAHYDILVHHRITSLRPGTLIVDEVHLLSNEKSKRSVAVLFYASIAKRVIGLSGTPLWNKPKGLWSLFAIANPGAWGRPFEFAQRYCDPEMTEHGWKYNGVSHRSEWLARRSQIVLARTWAQVLPDLPPVKRELIKIPIDRDSLFAVDVAAEELSKGTNLDITVLGRYRQAVGKYKVEAAIARAERARREGKPIVLWCWHKRIVNLIAKHLDGVFTMTGDDSGEKRAATIDAWNAAEAAPIVATLAVGQVGIDLSHGGDVDVVETMVELDWTAVVMSQAEMRPFNAKRQLVVEYLVLEHEVDELLTQAVLKKLERGKNFEMAAAGSTFELEEPDAHRDAEDILHSLGELLRRPT